MRASRKAFLPLGFALAGCAGELPFTPLNELYHLDVATTRAVYLPDDSVSVSIRNRDGWGYVWHRCPGVVLDRGVSSGWSEVTGDARCTPGTIYLPSDQITHIAFVMPSDAPPGLYRVRIRLSAIDGKPPHFWWPSGTFTVSVR